MPDDIALITADEARTYLGIESDVKPTDTWLETVIDGLSQQVMDYTGVKYLPLLDEPAARSFQYQGGLLIGIDETESVESVEYSARPGDEDSWTTLDADDYALEPLQDTVKDTIRLVTALELPEAGSGWEGLRPAASASETVWPSQARAVAQKFLAVRVTATWGVSVIPANIKLACMLWIKQLINRDVLLMSSELAEATIFRGPMPADVKAILDGVTSAGLGVEAV